MLLLHPTPALPRIQSHRSLAELAKARNGFILPRRGISCSAIRGGSRRDVEKLIAKTQHRRPRHVKGVKPSQLRLLEELEEEIATEEELRMLANVATEGKGSSPHENICSDQSQSNLIYGQDIGVSLNKDKHQIFEENKLGGGDSGVVSRTSNNGEDSCVNQLQQAQERSPQNENGGLLHSAEYLSSRSGNTWQEVRREPLEQLKDARVAMKEVSESTQDTLADTAKEVDETEDELGRNVSDAFSIGQNSAENFRRSMNEQFEKATSDVPRIAGEVAEVVLETAADTGDKGRGTANEVGQNLLEIDSAGQSMLENSGGLLSDQVQISEAQVQNMVGKGVQRIEEGIRKMHDKAQESSVRLHDSVTRAVEESARASDSVVMETLGLADVAFDAVKEAALPTSTPSSSSQSETDMLEFSKRASTIEKADGQHRGAQKASQPGNEVKEAEHNKYTGYKVLVAGASGRTGRLIVENLVGKRATVRALVRDAKKADMLKHLQNVEVIEGDLCKYETLKKAIGDCNVVICAVGAQAFPLDPFNTYQVEYEGVLNLVSAAKNQDQVKKFVLLSSIGAGYFQFIPLLFWKRQAELYLQRSGLDYTIVRAGGLRSGTSEKERVVLCSADSQFFGGISRGKVAEVCVASLVAANAVDKTVEVIAEVGVQKKSIEEIFSSI